MISDRVGTLQNYSVRLHIDKSVPPVKSAYRRQPYHMIKAIEKEINQMLLYDIIEPVDKPTEWLSQIVLVPKKQPGEVRITTDRE